MEFKRWVGRSEKGFIFMSTTLGAEFTIAWNEEGPTIIHEHKSQIVTENMIQVIRYIIPTK